MVDIGNILIDGYEDRTDGKVFDGKIAASLYAKLTGDETKTDISNVDINIIDDHARKNCEEIYGFSLISAA